MTPCCGNNWARLAIVALIAAWVGVSLVQVACTGSADATCPDAGASSADAGDASADSAGLFGCPR